MSNIFILWQDQNTKLWHPVAKLSHTDNIYRLNYTKGATKSEMFIPFPNLDRLDEIYESNELFPFFQNRILPSSRPEFKKLIRWIDMTPETFDPLNYLAITGGGKKTDNYRILKLPELVDGKYIFKFLISGVQYLKNSSQEFVNNLKVNTELEYFYELDNPVDQNAIGLKDKNSQEFIGYCPRYLVNDFKKLLESKESTESKFYIKKVNLDSPASYRLLCVFESQAKKNYKPLMFEEYLAHTIVH